MSRLALSLICLMALIGAAHSQYFGRRRPASWSSEQGAPLARNRFNNHNGNYNNYIYSGPAYAYRASSYGSVYRRPSRWGSISSSSAIRPRYPMRPVLVRPTTVRQATNQTAGANSTVAAAAAANQTVALNGTSLSANSTTPVVLTNLTATTVAVEATTTTIDAGLNSTTTAPVETVDASTTATATTVAPIVEETTTVAPIEATVVAESSSTGNNSPASSSSSNEEARS